MIRHIRVGALATVVVVLLGLPAGLLWAWLAPHTGYVVIGHQGLVADPETQNLIGADGRFAVITASAGLICAIAAYLLAGRLGEIALLVALAAGGVLAAFVAWRIGHLFGLSHYQHVVKTGADGTRAQGPLGLRAAGLVIIWPLVAVVGFGLMEALDVAKRNLAPGDGGGTGAGQPYQVGGGQFDLEATPTGRDVDRREP